MKSNYFLLSILAIAVSISALSFKTDTFKGAEAVVEQGTFDGGEFYYSPTGNFYEVTYTKDTIANAANDTLNLPSTLRNSSLDYQASLSITRTSISGTANIAVKVEETNHKYSGSTAPTLGWVTATNNANTSAATAATTATTETLLIPHMYGMNYRIILDGTGTQSTSYVCRWVFKKKT